MEKDNELKNLQVIKASAGSGKTYNLARTYIQHLLGRRRVVNGTVKYELRHSRNYQNHLLAITFTNKATAEMKTRIVTELYKLGRGEGDYVDDFKELFVDSIDEVARAARVALGDILFNYTTFNVSTIDSFFQSIVRTFARELNTAYNYELQLDANYATAVAVNDFLLDLGGNGPEERLAGRWVREYIRHNVDNERDWNFFGKPRDLVAFAENINREFFREKEKDIAAYLKDVAGNDSPVSRFVDKLGRAAEAHKAGYAALPDRLRAFFVALGRGEDDIKAKSINDLMALPTGTVPGKPTSTLRGYTVDTALTGKVLRKASTTGLPAHASLDFAKLMAEAIGHYDRWMALEAVRRNTWNLGLLDRIARHLEQYRHDNNTLLMADTADLIATTLKSGNEFIYEHVGAWINHYLIDEFQDTSRKQYDNFKPLLRGAIASGHQNLIIGDEKQAIYRFRNSDVAMLRDEIEKDFRPEDTGGKPLSTNYRSQRAIVEFNNRFFEAALGVFDTSRFAALKKTYAHIKQEISKDDVPGLVMIHFDYPGKKTDDDNDAPADVLTALPAYINELRRRKFAQRDIAILVDRVAEGRKVISQILRHNDTCADESEKINVVSSDSLALETSTAVKLIVSVLTSLEAARETAPPEDEDDVDDSDNTVPTSLNNRLAEQRRHKITNAFNKKLAVNGADNAGAQLRQCFEDDERQSDGMDARARLQSYYNSVAEVLPDADREQSSLVAIVDRIIDLYLGDATGTENAFIMAFQDLVVDFLSQSNGGTVREFLKYWNTKGRKLSISSPEGSDAVSVMTIHKSKGLQFPCVIVPLATWKLIDVRPDTLLWVTRDMWLNAAGQGVPLEGIGADDATIVPPLVPVPASAMERIPEFMPFFDSEKEKDLIDNLNKTYVAFTRPEEELHIFASLPATTPAATGDGPKSAAQLLRAVATGVNGMRVEASIRVNGKKDEELPTLLVMGESREKLPPKKDKDKAAPAQSPMPPYRVGFLPDTVTVSLPPAPVVDFSF